MPDDHTPSGGVMMLGFCLALFGIAMYAYALADRLKRVVVKSEG
jgi:hypothetical protein